MSGGMLRGLDGLSLAAPLADTVTLSTNPRAPSYLNSRLLGYVTIQYIDII